MEESDSYMERRPEEELTPSEPSPPSAMWIPLYLLGALVLGILTYLCHTLMILPELKSRDQNQLSAVSERLLLCALLGGMIWSIARLVLIYLSITLRRIGERQGFLQIFLVRSGWLIALVFTLLVLSFAMGSYNDRINMADGKGGSPRAIPVRDPIDTPKDQSTLATFVTKEMARLLLASSIFLGIILVKTILMEGLNYKMLSENYEPRIQKNQRDIRILEMLNRATGKKMLPDIEAWACIVFRTLSPERDAVDLQTLEYFFGTSNAQEMFQRFDIYRDGKLTRDNFILVYQGVLHEERRIEMGMMQKASIVKKLDLILSSVLVPLGVFAILSVMESTDRLVSTLPIQFSTLISLHVIFAPIIADMFRSLVFVFLVKSFDVGDKILVDGALHEVHDMGLLYTSFVVDKKISVIPNSKIMEKTIVNLRKAETSMRSFEFTFSNSLEFKDKVGALNAEIEKEVKSDLNRYTGKFNVHGYDLKKNSAIGVKIDAVFWVQNQNIRALQAKEDAFVIALHDIFRKLGLVLE